MVIFDFNKIELEKRFIDAENYLFDKRNLNKIKYDNFDISTFDKLNAELLNEVANKFIVYCLWQGSNENKLNPKYVGHAKNTISRQRMRAHLTKKNKATGAQLDKIQQNLNEKKYIGITYLIIEPSYMRTALEEWILNINKEKLEWNINR